MSKQIDYSEELDEQEVLDRQVMKSEAEADFKKEEAALERRQGFFHLNENQQARLTRLVQDQLRAINSLMNEFRQENQVFESLK